MKLTVYGHSDDLVEIEGDWREEFSFDSGAMVFSDGTILEVEYGNSGVWKIIPNRVGDGTKVERVACLDDSEDGYSDRVTLEGEFKWVVAGELKKIKETTKK